MCHNQHEQKLFQHRVMIQALSANLLQYHAIRVIPLWEVKLYPLQQTNLSRQNMHGMYQRVLPWDELMLYIKFQYTTDII